MGEYVEGTRGRARTLLVAIMIMTGMMLAMINLPTENASGQIIDSFEGGLGSWVAQSDQAAGFWDVVVSSTYAFDGANSVSMWNHGMPPTQIVWIERSVPVPSGDTRNVEMTFQLYSEAPLDTPRDVHAYIGLMNPSSILQFTTVGQTDQAIGWIEYNHSATVTSGPPEIIYVALGFANPLVGSGKTYYFDYVVLTNVSDDMSPPLFTNLTPPDDSFTSNTMPSISANYTDPSGMNLSTVLMEVDGTDVTASSTINPTGIQYVPTVPLSEGPHTVYLEARDASINRNYGNVTWNFTVDTSPPIISNLQPPDLSTTNDNTPNISADYTDPAGINVGSVMVEVDAVDVTAQASVTQSNVTYTPTAVLADGVHNVYLEVEDTVGNQGTASWSFTVDTSSDGTPPTITNLNPANLSTIGETFPQISANYSDFSGINATSVYLEVDLVDVTSQAVVNTEGVSYIPAVALSEALHNVFLSVEDNSINSNMATVSWEFTVEDTPPVTTLIVGNPSHSAGGTEYFTSGTPFTLSADDGGGTGVNSTWYRTWDATGWTPLTKYMSTFTFSGADGARTVEYNSTDNVTNHETPNNYSVISMLYLDNSAPVSGIALGNPTFVSGPDTYITNSTEVNLTASDVAGIDGIWYRIDVGGSWTLYNGNFTIAAEGTHTIYFNATDNVGNIEISQTMTVIVDNTPPTTILSLGTPIHVSGGMTYFTSATQFTLSATDTGSGVASILHMTWEGGTGWTPLSPYSSPFALSGSDGLRFIEYGSEDNLTNQEVPTNHTSISGLYLDDSDPVSVLTVGAPNYISGPDTFVSPLTEFNLTAWDATGADYILYRIDSGGPVTYTGNFTLSTAGSHTIYYNATDFLGNVEVENGKTVIVDAQAPVTAISVGTPNATAALTVISSMTEITLIPDDGTGSGVAQTMYKIGDDPYVPYTGPFTLSGNPSGQHIIHYYSTDNVGNVETENSEIVLLDDQPPTAVAGPDVAIVEGTTVSFNASQSTDNSGLISDYTWTFTFGGLPVTLNGVGPAHQFTEPGDYSVTLTVTDAMGNSGTDTMWVNVSAITDSDNDGLPDSWEEEYFGNLDQDADDDPDNDGFDNLEEWNNGTDPTVSDKEEPPSEFPWWLILVAVVIILFLILLLLMLKRRRSDEEPPQEETEEIEGETEEEYEDEEVGDEEADEMDEGTAEEDESEQSIDEEEER
jgi:hypothetical protein